MAMDDRKPGLASISTGHSGAYIHAITTPDVIQRHDISDEELTMVESGNRTFAQDIMWVSLGAFLGALVPALTALEEFNSPSLTFSMWDLIECVICFAALSVFVVTFLIRKSSGQLSSDTAQNIRDRSSKRV